MTALKSTSIQPRLLGLQPLCSYLGLTKQTFTKMLPELRKKGFPHPVPLLGLWDRHVIDSWLDHLSGLDRGRYSLHPPQAAPLGNTFEPIKRTAPLPPSKRSQNPYTVAEAMSDYCDWFRQHRKSLTRTQYSINAYIIPHFGHRRVEDLTAPELRAWHVALANSPRSVHVGFGKPRRLAPPPQTDEEKRKRRQSANGILMILKAALNFAARDGKVSNDTAWRSVKMFKGVLIANAAYLTADECRKLMPVLAPDFRRLARGALYTGGRLMELSRLTAADFDAVAGSIHFAPAKTIKARHVVLTDEGQAFFKELTHNLMPGDLIFRRADGEAWRAADPGYRLQSACQVADIKRISFHGFRHTYASLLVMAGASLTAVSKNLGHTKTEISERYYAHLSPSYLGAEVRDHMPELNLGKA